MAVSRNDRSFGIRTMSSNCGKCGVKLGVYEYNLVNNEVLCDHCSEGRIRAQNPLPEDSCWKVVEGFEQLKSVMGVPSNRFKFYYFFSLIMTVLFIIGFLYDRQMSLELISGLICSALMISYSFGTYRRRQHYKVHEHTLIIKAPNGESESVVDLRKIDSYTSVRHRLQYDLTLFTGLVPTANIVWADLKNFKELSTCITQNLDTINVGKYFTKETNSYSTTVTFIDPPVVDPQETKKSWWKFW
jgi:hypothetical protein